MIKQFYFKQFNLACYLFALTLNVKQFYLTHRYYLPTPPLGQDMTQGQFLSGV